MWRRRTFLFASCLNSNSWFYLLPHSQLQYLNPIKGYKEISLSQTQATSSESRRMASPAPLLYFQSTPGLPMRFLLPSVAFPVLVSSDEATTWRSDVTGQSSWRKAQCCIQTASKLNLPAKHGQGTWLLEKHPSVGLDCINPHSKSCIFSLFTCCDCTRGGVAGCHTSSPHRPAPRCWQKGSSGDWKDISFWTFLLPVSPSGRGQPVEGFSSSQNQAEAPNLSWSSR